MEGKRAETNREGGSKQGKEKGEDKKMEGQRGGHRERDGREREKRKGEDREMEGRTPYTVMSKHYIEGERMGHTSVIHEDKTST